MSQSLQSMRGQDKNNPIATLNHYFTAHKGQLAAALPKHLNPDRMARLALTAFSQNPALAKCDPKTIFSSVIVASQLGLELGVVGQAYLVPYKNTCTCIPGWQGYVDLVSRTGRGSVWTGAVFQGDHFDYALGDSPYLKHRPEGEDNPDLMTHVYAIGRVNEAEWPIIEVWPVKRIWKHRDKNNKVGKSHYSFKHPEMYARKVPLMQVIKYMPKSIELASAMDIDQAAAKGQGSQFIEGDFVPLDVEPNESAPEQDQKTNQPEQEPEPEKADTPQESPRGHTRKSRSLE